MVTYQYKLFKTKKTRHLESILGEACFVWNHALALQKRYYAIYHGYVGKARMQKQFAKRIRRTYIHSQSCQEVIERLDNAYRRFFKKTAKRPPKFKKKSEFRSFVFKQGGFSLCGNVFHLNSTKKDYRFSYSRPYEGNVKQLRVRRSPKGEWYIYVVTDAVQKKVAKTHDGAGIGMDFGLKTYLTLSNGDKIQNPQFLKKDISKLRSLSRSHSRKRKGSKRREEAKRSLASFHEHVANKRKDWQRKLANELCRKYDYIFIEDLSLRGMTHLWGRKMHDLAHAKFVNVLVETASRYGCIVHKIDRFYPSSRLCDCGYRNDGLKLCDREWVCPHCGCIHDRDVHAAENIFRRGIYELASGSKTSEGFPEWRPAKTLMA